MNRKMLVTVMSLIVLAAVYILADILLPRCTQKQSVSHGGIPKTDYSESKEDSIHINLSEKAVVIDSGHGGVDPGKISADGILEKDINLAIAYKLKNLLEQSQIQVIMTRTDDNGLYSASDTNKKSADMKKRCSIINDSNADIVVSIHQNSFSTEGANGAQAFYYKQSEQGKKLASYIQDAFREHLDSGNKRVEKADSSYYMLLHTKIPTVIAECGFLSNKEEAALLNSEEYQQKVAEALYNAIVRYLTEE